MPPEKIIGVIGQIATWVTILLVFLTLREMEKQRKASQKPELIIPKVFVQGHYDNWCELAVPTEWKNKEQKAKKFPVNSWANLIIYNIGFGAAKNLILTWDFDTPKIQKDIKDYCYQNSIPIVVSVERNFLNIVIKKAMQSINIEAYSVQEHEYIMPASVTSSGIQSKLPLTYLNLLAIFHLYNE